MIISISSKDNEKVKLTKSLLKSKNRIKESKFLIEGFRIVTQAIDCNADLQYVFINENFEIKEEHKKFLEVLKSRNIKIYKTTNKIFNDFIDTENTQGIVGVVGTKERKIEEILSEDCRFVLILDRIQDPGNMGTIIRTADAAGVDAIINLKGCVDIYNSKVIRSTMGSIFDMKIINMTQHDAVKELKNRNFEIVSSYLDTDNFYDGVEYNYKTALVIGNEANGVNDELIKESNTLVKIPIYGKAESLNAAISSAILMYEIKKYMV
ncbi:TrmH family RNA methyltransferase [Paraclostridium bifermentans]|uniref:TrmH family RNA methyltransferase n=1 Tax=Paraclostridium bifermentans TaxID=1490 RepID=UPI00359C5EC3